MHKLKSPLAIVFTIILIDVLGIGILIPVIPLLLTDPSYAYHLHGLSVAQGFVVLGWLTAVYPLMQFIATPLLGQLSDHVGRRPVLAFSLLGTSLGYVVFAFGVVFQHIPLLFAARALDGLTGGNISVAQAAIADSTTPEKRARSFGIIGAAFGIGFIIGPFLGGKLSDPSVLPWFNATTPFWFAALISLLNALAVLFLFSETLKEKSHEAFHWGQAFINIQKAALNKKLSKLFTVSFLFQAGFTFFTTFLGAYMISRFAFTQGNIGDFFAFIGLWIALTQGFVTGMVGKRFAPHTILSVALLGVALTVAGYALVPSGWMLYALAVPQAICMGLIMANLTGLISRSADSRSQGEVLGINASVQAVAQALPPAIAGYIAAAVAPNAPILVGSLLVFSAWLVFILFTRNSSRAISGHEKPLSTT